MKNLLAGGSAAVLLWLAPSSFAAETALEKNKSAYHLFKPTPRALLRALSTDRPDKTESPFTVDAGRFQIETDLVNYVRNRERNQKIDNWTLAGVNLKAGLLHWMDVQIVLEPYRHQRVRDHGASARASGFGDTTVRLKMNLWGNDGGPTAFALMPFVKFPTASRGLGNDAVEGGLIVPFAVELPADWSMGIMLEIDFNQNDDRSAHHAEFIQTITFARPIAGPWSGFIELFSQFSEEKGSAWIATLDFGVTCALSADVQLDAGLNVGLTRAADDLNPFLGLTVRF